MRESELVGRPGRIVLSGADVLAEYTLSEPIGEADGVVFYRGLAAGKRVLLKVTIARPSPRELIRLEHELELAVVLPEQAAVRPLALTSVDGRVALALEYFDGASLSRLLSGPMELPRLLAIAVGISAALIELHRTLVHRNLNPNHILVDPATHEVKLTGFGIASLIPSEQQTSDPPLLLEGALPYISPEQTRRTTHPIDARSDLYSLGIVLYQLATGALPFHGRDLLDWVHCHIARTPAAARDVVPGFPPVVSDIIGKLLAKSPEDRYQTAAGLHADLQRCLDAYATRGEIPAFPLGSRDVSSRFEIPAKTYGRQHEKAALLAAFDRVAERGTPSVFLIAGPTGSGKTTLARQLHQRVMSTRAFFAAGKCDQYSHHTPYQALGQACSSLVGQVLARSDEEIGRWRAELTRAVGLHGRLVSDLVPGLTTLIGEQPPVIELPVTQAEVRLFQVFWRFLNTFAAADHPLVLFLDDLQWADSASLRLLHHVVGDPDTQHLLLVGAYRDSDVSPSHPLRMMIEQLRPRAGALDEVVLRGLSADDIGELLTDTLHHPPGETATLATLVHERTAGNPFYVRQFLTALHDEGMFQFDAQSGWSWDIERIRQKRVTDNIADLMIQRLGALLPATLELVRLAACLGGRFTLARLAAIAERNLDETRRDLFEAIRAGLLVRYEDGYVFVHDRVQQAAYALVTEGERPALHRRIGWLLAGTAPPAALGDELFEVASHLVRGASALAGTAERRRVSAFILEAGSRARAGAAYGLAAEFLSSGIALLDAASWDEDYETAYGLHFELAQCQYLMANPADAEQLLGELFARARTRSELAALHRMKIEVSWMRDDLESVIDEIVGCLRLFDVVLERHPSPESVSALYERAVSALGDRPIEVLATLPPASSPEIQQLLSTLSSAFPGAYWYDANLHFALSSLAVRLAIEHGVSPSAAHVFADFGMIIGARMARYEDGYRFGRVAIDLVQRPGYESVKAKVFMVFGGMTAHWTRPLSESSFVENAFASGVEIGDLLHASNSCVLLLENLIGSSSRLDVVHERASSFHKFLVKTKFLPMADVVACETHLVETLRGTTAAHPVADAWWRDKQQRPGSRFGRVPCMIAELQAAVLFGDDDLAADLALDLEPVAEMIRGYWRVADYHFLSALALAARYPHVDGDRQGQLREKLHAHRDRYAVWARLCPENFVSRYALICAEIAALAGDDLDAIKGYEQAIAEARKVGSLSNEAMAYEMAARFYRSRDLDLIAATYLREARTCYRQWGADGKVRWLDARHPDLDAAARAAPASADISVSQIDAMALATSLRAIASEIDRPKLLSTIMRVVMQQAGADRGVLLNISAEEWSAEVEGVLVGDELVIRAAPSAFDSAVAAPVSVIRRVSRRREPFLLADAERELLENGDGAYFAARKPRSALCVPVTRRGAVVGAIYLENHGLHGAFSPDTVRTTQLLTLQVAISLENAELYSGLLKENTQRRAAELALQASRAHLQSVLEHMVDAVIACDATGRITLANRACEALLGYTRSDLEGAPMAQVAAAIQLGSSETEPFAEAALPLRRALQGATCVDVPATLVRARTDTRAHVRISSAPIVGPGGEIAGAVSVIHDVTASAQLELMKDQFIRVAAHELKTPVAIVQMAAQELVDAPLAQPDKVASRADMLARGAGRIHRIVETILLMSALQDRRLVLALEDVDLGALTSQIVGEAAHAHRRSIQLRAEPVIVRADRERLTQVLTHVLDNAIKYSPAGGSVDVEITRREHDAVAHIRDRGVGIPANKQAHIFERFFRAHTDTPYDVGGIGLGLYISRELARQHGGDLWFESEEGVGTTFHLSLPQSIEKASSQTTRAP